MAFDRYKLFEGRSLAHRLFKRHHTHFNDMFWSQRVVHDHAFSLTRPYQREDPISALFAVETNQPRSAQTLNDWAKWYSGFDDWSRMAYVIGIAGYLETYIAQIATAAFESTPSLLFGGGLKLDGAPFLKHNPKYDLYEHSERLTKGDWQARISAYRSLFGSCPFEDRLSDLEELRTLRNAAGHSFGRDIKSMKFAQGWEVKKIKRISDAKIIELLELIESVANHIEKHIAKELVGQYEIIKVYHQWWPRSDPKTRTNTKLHGKDFRRHFFGLTSGVYRPTALLFQYYDSL